MAKMKKARKRKVVGKKMLAARAKAAHAKKRKRAKRRPRGPNSFELPPAPSARGLGAGAAGQSGDIQGVSRGERVDSESVEELTEEGQDYEAEVVRGIEDAPDPDEGREGRVRTRRYIPPDER